MNVTGPSSIPHAYAPQVTRPVARNEAPTAAPDAAAPKGESSLWDVLTPEERDFFARQESLGPVTYGRTRRAAPAPEAPLGSRIDVRG